MWASMTFLWMRQTNPHMDRQYSQWRQCPVFTPNWPCEISLTPQPHQIWMENKQVRQCKTLKWEWLLLHALTYLEGGQQPNHPNCSKHLAIHRPMMQWESWDMILETIMLAETAPDHHRVDKESLVMKPMDLVQKKIHQPFRKGVPCMKGCASS